MSKLKKYSFVLYWAIVIALLGMFFTNDFGLLDIHKTSLIVAIGIDIEDDKMQVTARLASPQPSQSGDNIQYYEVKGTGETLADALNEINTKTGHYPKLLFCKLILLGESCKERNLFKSISCLYRKNYSELTADIAMCKGNAGEMLAMPATVDPENATAILRSLSAELKKSANVASVNLKDIAAANFSESKTCFMPFIEAVPEDSSHFNESETGGSGSSGNSGGQSGGQSQGGESGGSGGGEGQSGGSGGQGGESGGQSQGGGQGGKMQFTARKTAIFSNGEFVEVLDENQSFALNILNGDIRLAVLPCLANDTQYTLGLKDTSHSVSLSVKEGVPELKLGFKAKAQIRGAKVVIDPKRTLFDDVVKEDVLKSGEEELKARIQKLVDVCVEKNCDVLGAYDSLYKFNYKYYDAFKENLLSKMKVTIDVKLKSAQ